MTLVRFLATPVDAFIDLQGGLDGMQREVHLSTLSEGAAAVSVEGVDGIVVHREAMDQIRTTLHEQSRAARAAGRATVDLEAEYPDDQRDRILAVMAGSREANEAAEAGDLLSPPLSPEVRRVQEWMYREVLVQLDGGEPTPYGPPDAG